MTVTDESVNTAVENTDSEKKKRERDFTKYRSFHKDLADYINARSGLDAITPNQIKAVLLLRTDYANEPDQVSAREQRNARLKAEQAQYEGMTDDQKKAAIAGKKAREQAEKLQARAAEAIAKANELAAQASGSGEDLAAVVAAQQSTDAEPEQRRGLRRR